jgi:hypothetical protein
MPIEPVPMGVENADWRGALRGPQGRNVVHGRLPWTMHLLRYAVGDSAFGAAMPLLFERWRFRSFTLDQFVATLAEGAGQSLDWWRDEWLDRRGVPEIAWHAAIASGRGAGEDRGGVKDADAGGCQGSHSAPSVARGRHVGPSHRAERAE